MSREKKIGAPVTLFAAIEKEQYEFLRTVAFRERRSLADVVREAIAAFMHQQRKRRASLASMGTRTAKRGGLRSLARAR